jgi:hypothetical protein
MFQELLAKCWSIRSYNRCQRWKLIDNAEFHCFLLLTLANEDKLSVLRREVSDHPDMHFGKNCLPIVGRILCRSFMSNENFTKAEWRTERRTVGMLGF